MVGFWVGGKRSLEVGMKNWFEQLFRSSCIVHLIEVIVEEVVVCWTSCSRCGQRKENMCDFKIRSIVCGSSN